MSKSRTGWLLAICLSLPLAGCLVAEGDEEQGDPAETEELVTEEAETGESTAPEAIEAQDCQFSQQCDPCEPPWVQQTAQRVWNECGATGTMWAIKYYCALCD
jgi:hypothetical protein